MMTNDDYQHFVCVVAGDNPNEILLEYDKTNVKAPYVKYRFKDAKMLQQKYIEFYEGLLKNLSETNDTLDLEMIKNTIEDLKEMSETEFYHDLISDLDFDEKTGDAYTTENENGKFSFCQLGKIYSIPFLTKDGREVFQARKSEIDWGRMHLSGGDIYARAWEMVMEESKPETDYEALIYDNMKDKVTYFEKFETKENYVISNTAFWGYAFVSESKGWMDASEVESQFVWMNNFYDLFIKNLPEDTLLSIYECKK